MNQFLKLYNNSKNPLDDDKTLEKIVNAYILKGRGSWMFYEEIEKIGTEGKTSTPPPVTEKNQFWSVLFNNWKRNILNDNGKINPKKYKGHFSELVMNLKQIPDISTYDELCNIVERYPLISKYGIMPSGDRIWNFILSRDINGTKEDDVVPNYRLYINSEAKDTYQLVAGFIGKCAKRKLPYYLKFIDVPEDYTYRADSIVIWADEKTLFQYIEILNEIKNEIPSVISRCKEPPILTMKINNWIGFGTEPKGNDDSYTSARIKLLMNSINTVMRQWIIENQDKKIIYGKTRFSIKQYIAAKAIKDEFDIIKEQIKKRPQVSARYGVKINELDKDLYVKLCSEIVNEVIPAIKANHYIIKYKKSGGNMFFDFSNPINEIFSMIAKSDNSRASIFEKIRENIRLNSKQYGIDEKKFIFNDDYLTSIKEEER